MKIVNFKKKMMFFSFAAILSSCNQERGYQSIQENSSSLSSGAFYKKDATLENSAILFIGKDIKTRGKYARQISVKSYNSNLAMEPTMAINYNEYTDDGTHNDIVAGDGTYTSVSLYDKPISSDLVGGALMSDEFLYNESLTTSILRVECKIRRKRSGYTFLFHDDCSKVWCIEVYDCKVIFGH